MRTRAWPGWVLALATTSALGCIERDPCFYPETYDGCVADEPLAGCPGYGPIVLGPAPNVPPDYVLPTPGEPVTEIDADADFSADYEGWALRVDDNAGAGALQYMALDGSTERIRYAFDLRCADLEAYDGHRLHVWVRARVEGPGTGFMLGHRWGPDTSRLMPLPGQTGEIEYVWGHYNALFEDNPQYGEYDPNVSGRQTAVWVQPCFAEEVCPNGPAAGVERVVVTGDPDYRPPGVDG